MSVDPAYNLKFRLFAQALNQEHLVLLKEGEPYTIGRQGKGLQLLDASVSRHHLQLVNVGGRVFVEDLGSTNGTFVAGERVTRAELAPGTLVQFGIFAIEVIQTPATIKAGPAQPLNTTLPPAYTVNPQRNRSAEDLDLSVEGIKWFFTEAVTNPTRFFSGTQFTGSPMKSAKVILFSFFLGHVLEAIPKSLQALRSNISADTRSQLIVGTVTLFMMTTALSIAQIFSLSWGLDKLRDFIQSDGKFREYLRFFAYVSMLYLAAQVVSILTMGLLWIVLALAILLWTAYGLVKVFEPSPFPFVAIIVVFGVIWMVLQKGIMNIVSPLLFIPQ